MAGVKMKNAKSIRTKAFGTIIGPRQCRGAHEAYNYKFSVEMTHETVR